MKKAFLVSLVIYKRVIADENATEEEVAKIAMDEILQDNPTEYINSENVDLVVEDTEMPYTPEIDG